MKNLLLVFTVIIASQISHSQSYPEPQNGFKRVDLKLPKLENEKNYKIEVRFSFEANVVDCSNADFSFNPKNLKTQYGANFNRFPYYVLENDMAEISEGYSSECVTRNKVRRKLLSSQNLFIEYQSYYARPFYIPESWSVEYRIWNASEIYTTVK